MPRLIINPGTPSAWEIQLRPGTNRVGRGSANDFTIADPSVSTAHCEFHVSGSTVVLKDLGSTNGTFVDRAAVQETEVRPGQAIQLGAVQMLLSEDAASAAPIAAPPRPMVRMATASVPTAVPMDAAPAAAAPINIPPGPHPCKGHPKTQARFYCPACAHFFCELCVSTHPVQGVPRKFCRHCNTPCTALQIQLPAAPKPMGFFGSLPGAFAYPFKGSGVLILLVGALLLGGLGWLSGGTRLGFVPQTIGWGILFMVFVYGYLFSFTQNIIHSTAIGENEMPPLPSMGNFWEDILLPCLQLFGLSLVSFAPAIVLAFMYGGTIMNALIEGSLADVQGQLLMLAGAYVLGLIYFPMAFLAVSVLDSVLAANPVTVLTSMFKVPLEYLVTLAVVGLMVILGVAGDGILAGLFPRGLTTHSMSKLFGYLGLKTFWGVANIYLIVVTVRILGLLYLTRKQKLAWLPR